MMGATLPAKLIKPDFHRHTSDFDKYARLEYGEGDPTWLVMELDSVVRAAPALKHRSERRSSFSLRAFVARVASVLF